MIQFSKPRRPLNQPDRFGFGAQDALGTGLNGGELLRRADGPTRFDQSFYSAVGGIPSDLQSVRSQATYTSGLPSFGPGQFSGRSYASCKYRESSCSREPRTQEPLLINALLLQLQSHKIWHLKIRMPSQTIPVLSQAALPFRKLTVSDVILLVISDRITSLSIKMMILEVKSPSLPRLQTFRRNLSSHRTSLKDWFLNYLATMVAHEHARMHRSSRKRRSCLWDIRYSPPGHLRYRLIC